MKKDLGLYIHIPFCVKKCNYCDFNSGPDTDEGINHYIRILQKEIRAFEPIRNLYQLKTIYFGGGTPSILDANQFSRVFNQITDCFDIASGAEISVECNPGTIGEEKLRTYKSLGVNRLSIGLQSANDIELKALGRIHNYDEFLCNFSLARRVGFDNINIDLMSGIPSQTINSYESTLNKIVEIEPEHISAYSLIIEPGTPFYDKYGSPAGKLLLPSEDDDRKMYKITKELLSSFGYDRYEISNYSKIGYECKHNITYWTLGEYLGLGLSAASFLDGKRFTNPSKKENYWEKVKHAYVDYKNCSHISQKEKIEEYMFLGLRMSKGISINMFEELFGTKFSDVYGGITSLHIEKGLMNYEGDRLYLTDKGIDVSNMVLANYLLG